MSLRFACPLWILWVVCGPIAATTSRLSTYSTDQVKALERGADSVYDSRTLGQRREQHGFTLFPGGHPEQGFGPNG